MNPFIRLSTRALMAVLLLGFIACLPASAWAKEKKTANSSTATSPQGELLHQAYGILEKADHDYKGHRRAAMEQIEAAAKQLGFSLHGDGKVKEKQAISDDQLRQALAMVEKAQTGLAGNKKVEKHLAAAIKDLKAALAIK